jgi:hypothetical protein
MCLPKNGRKLLKGTFISVSQFPNFPNTIETGWQYLFCSFPEQLFLKYTFKKQMLAIKQFIEFLIGSLKGRDLGIDERITLKMIYEI